MVSKASLGTLAELLLAALVLSTLVGQLVGTPIGLGYVQTGSMRPTMEPGDGFVAIPRPLAGPITDGDVVVYDAENLHDGGLVTHRVVGRTGGGYATKGDANPFADQQGTEPPVRDSQVVAVALQVGGRVVVVPGVGALSTTVDGAVLRGKVLLYQVTGLRVPSGSMGLLATVSVLLGLVFAYDTLAGAGSGRSRERSRGRDHGSDVRFVLAVVVLLLVTSATLSMVLPSGPRSLPSDPTERQTGTYAVRNSGVLPIVARLETDGHVSVRPAELRVDRLASENASVAIPAGATRPRLVEHRYLALLPRPVIRTLYEFHPWAPIVVIDALVGVPFYLLGLVLVGRGRVRDRSRSRDASLPARARRLLRAFY
ncbi:MAG: signal peptidase I [Halobacteriaceae archaeon]